MNKPQYKTLVWLVQPWPAQALRNMGENDIRIKQSQVDEVVALNQSIYEQVKAERLAAKQQFRKQHPRMVFPPELLRSVERPPDVAGQWKALLNRRTEAFKKQIRPQEAKKEAFVDRMMQGQLRAAQRREQAIRKLIDEKAADRGIELTGRDTDKRLAELFEKMGGNVRSVVRPELAGIEE